MADAMLSSKGKDKKSSAKTDEELLLSDQDECMFEKVKESSRAKPSSSKTSSKAKSSGGKVTASSSKSSNNAHTKDDSGVSGNTNFGNNDIISLLKQIRDDQNKQNDRVDKMNQRIDELFDVQDEYDDIQYDENGNELDCDEVQSQANDNGDKDEPQAKKQKTDEQGRFSSLGKRFRSGEKTDKAINSDLAENITDIFRNGISSERYKDLMKDDRMNRPDNCDGLVTVHTDQMVWDLLFQNTKTVDNKMKNIQTIIVKGATVLTKVVDKLDKMLQNENSDEMSTILDDCMDSLALMGHANRHTCLLRRELMKPDILDDYGHLFNQTVSYDKYLFGGDVAKKVDDIGKCNRISNRIRGGNRGGFRGGFGRGYGRFFRGRGGPRGNRGRGRVPSYSRPNDDKMASKNSRWTYNKYRQ